LNDNIIDYYFSLLFENNSYYTFFDSFFYASLVSRGLNSVLNRKKNVNVFQYRKIFIPIVENYHWLLVVVDVELHRIVLYDSFGRKYPNNMCNISKYFNCKYSQTFSNIKIWDLTYATDLPKQTNSYDCGMYVCKFAEFITKNRCFNFNDASMKRYRQKL